MDAGDGGEHDSVAPGYSPGAYVPAYDANSCGDVNQHHTSATNPAIDVSQQPFAAGGCPG
eukprot:1154605-Pelagomonas_calceolata.AAC.6